MRPPDFFTVNYNLAPHTSRPEFLLSGRDRLAELNSFTGRSKHPGSKPGFAHRHQPQQVELRQHVLPQVVVSTENQAQPKMEGIGTIDSPLMAAVFLSALANNEFVKKNGPRLAVIALALALTTCLPQQSTPTPENPPAVVVVTNTPLPDLGLTPSVEVSPTLAAIQTETPFFGSGGPELPGGSMDQIKLLLESGMPLPSTDCVASPETGGNRERWDKWIQTLVENGASQTAINDLQTTINAKLKAWGISGSTGLELCAGGDGGWSLTVRDKYSGILWWSYDLKNQRFADRPDRVFNDRDWQFRPMPRNGLKSGLEVEIMMVNGWPLAVAVNPEGRPIQHFDPVLGEFINFYPDPDTATPAPSNTPRPTPIPATAAPKPSPVPSEPIIESSPIPQPEGFISTRGVLPTREELIGCATGVKLSPREVDAIDPVTGKPFHHYRNRVASNSGGVLTFEDGRMEDINRFVVPRIIQVIFDDPTNNNRWDDFNNAYSIADFAQLIKQGDVVAMDWEDGTPIEILLFCNSR